MTLLDYVCAIQLPRLGREREIPCKFSLNFNLIYFVCAQLQNCMASYATNIHTDKHKVGYIR